MIPLQEGFFSSRGTIELAKGLIGKALVSISKEGTVSGMIVETEAYLQHDPACHASRGKTRRNQSMFGQAGTAYVYFVYGMHHCFNVVSGPEGIGEAVLIRSVEPMDGLDIMASRRRTEERSLLARGPGRLCEAFDIDRTLDGHPLWEKPLFIADWASICDNDIVETGRIGVRAWSDKPLRFVLRGSSFVSGRL